MKRWKSACRELPWQTLATLAAVCGLLYAQFHLFGNTTEIEFYGRSVFNWMLTLWKSGRIFGGSVYYLGWITPVVTGVLIYLRRRELAGVPRGIFWPGLAVIALGLFMHWAGARAQQTRLSLIALIVIVWAIPLFLYGWPLARQLFFPIGLLVFCVPLNFLDALTFPMRILSARMAAVVLNGIGLPIMQSGSAILAAPPATYAIDGGDPASGLGTLLMLAMITLVAGYMFRDPFLLRIILPAMVIPAMIVAGALRLVFNTALAEVGLIETALNIHRTAGVFVIMAASLLFLWLIRRGTQRLMHRFFTRE